MSIGDFSSMEDSVTQSFQKYSEVLSQENLIREEIRAAVRDLEEHARNLTNIIQAVHHPQGILRVSEISNKCSKLLEDTSSKIRNLATKFDPLCYYKYHDQWRFTLQRLVFVVLFVKFMNSNENNHEDDGKNKETLQDISTTEVKDTNNYRKNDTNTIKADVTDTTTVIITSPTTDDNVAVVSDDGGEEVFFIKHEECAKVLGLTTDMIEGFHLEVEDYLSGLLMLSSELARLSTNAVTCGNYDLPLRIGRFVGKLDQGFRLLNLKNDHLRRRYDGLKYDLKRVEEIAYDLSIRGLK